jgi:CheY-like chemotaxis protein
MDINLPGQRGLKATTQIRKIDKDGLIFAQTAYTDDHNMESAFAVGCNEFISKPIIQEI